MKWDWKDPEKELPETVVEQDWGKQSKAVLGDYGKDEECRFIQLKYVVDDDGEPYENWCSPEGEECAPPENWCSPEGEECAPPERWVYIEEE